MKIYLDKNDYKINKSFIMVAPTGTGKTQALIEYLKETNEHCIFVSPLNSIGKQVQEKSEGYFTLINCENKIDTILSDVINNLLQKKSIIISLNTFIKYKNIFYNYNVYIDECHFLIEYNNLIDTENLAKDIRNNKFKKIVGLTATPFGISRLLNLEEIKPDVKSPSKKNIKLHWIKNYSLSYLVGNIYQLYKENGKTVILYNNISTLEEIEKELVARNLNVKLYTSQRKDIQIVNEYFTDDFDILLCTNALSTGVSIKNNYYAIYIHRTLDSVNTVPQFFSRNRNKECNGCILKKFYCKQNLNISSMKLNDYFNKTDVNIGFTQLIMNNLQNICYHMTKEILDYFINTCGDYTFSYGKIYEYSEQLLIEQRFVQYIENQKQYFEDNILPKFNKGHYFLLYRIYELYDIFVFGYGDDDIMNSYIMEYNNIYNRDEILDRGKFYDFSYEKIKNYKKDVAIDLAKKCTNESLDLQTFEELFLDKPYNKSVFKKECTERFALKSEIFKNQNTTNEWLKKIGYVIRKSKNGHVIRKLK